MVPVTVEIIAKVVIVSNNSDPNGSSGPVQVEENFNNYKWRLDTLIQRRELRPDVGRSVPCGIAAWNTAPYESRYPVRIQLSQSRTVTVSFLKAYLLL